MSWCHCKDCRRQTGAPAVVWAGFRVEEVAFEGTPKRRRSSEHVVRSFCADCGTPITYEHDELAGEIYIHAGLFDEADRLVPDRARLRHVKALLDASGGWAGRVRGDDARSASEPGLRPALRPLAPGLYPRRPA